MDNINLSLLSRPQLVHLLLQIVDLLAQPLPQPDQPLHPGQVMHAPPRLEPYDASIDPWNEPELAQPVTATNPEVRCPGPMHGSTYLGGALNPGATAFYPMVPGAACSQRSGVTCEPSPEPAPGLPHFGAYPQADPLYCSLPTSSLPPRSRRSSDNSQCAYPQYVPQCYSTRTLGITRAGRRCPPDAALWMQV